MASGKKRARDGSFVRCTACTRWRLCVLESSTRSLSRRANRGVKQAKVEWMRSWVRQLEGQVITGRRAQWSSSSSPSSARGVIFSRGRCIVIATRHTRPCWILCHRARCHWVESFQSEYLNALPATPCHEACRHHALPDDLSRLTHVAWKALQNIFLGRWRWSRRRRLLRCLSRTGAAHTFTRKQEKRVRSAPENI